MHHNGHRKHIHKTILKFAINSLLSLPAFFLLSLVGLIILNMIFSSGFFGNTQGLYFFDAVISSNITWAIAISSIIFQICYVMIFFLLSIFNRFFSGIKSFKWLSKLGFFTPSLTISMFVIIAFSYLVVLLFMQGALGILIIPFVSTIILLIFIYFSQSRFKHNTITKKFRYIFLASLTTVACVISLWFSYVIFDETTPDTYQDIVFGDSHGKYVVNYDGDWWLTYYIDQNKCYENTGHMCIPSFVKKGNASIIESPVSLDVYRDKEVLVDAITMDPWKWQINSKGKIFCITGDDCKASTGPGYWYMTPVIIKSIKFAK